MVRERNLILRMIALLLMVCTWPGRSTIAAKTTDKKPLKPAFQTSDRCLACHNGLFTPSGADVSIGTAWRASIMANSSRDPYWQGSVRREILDHPKHDAHIQDECAHCHMPIVQHGAQFEGKEAEIFSRLPFSSDKKDNAKAEDGVDCSVCHQISPVNFGKRESFNGNFVIGTPDAKDNRPEYGPFAIENGQVRIMHTSSGGFRPEQAAHIRESELCATCHTLFTEPLDDDGKPAAGGQPFPEQMPYLEWLRSDYQDKQSCQSCHMPEFPEDAPIAAVLGVPRHGARQHTFVGANFLMTAMLNRYRDELSVVALPEELSRDLEATTSFLRSQAARVTITGIQTTSDGLDIAVHVENLTGHKLPTAYPSRRAWLHLVVQDRSGQPIFESGALRPDGSIVGNDNDEDAARFEPHYQIIRSREEVQIYEPILKNRAGNVTTGLLQAVEYIKDNRLLPSGFNKRTAEHEVAVVGAAADDPEFSDAGHVIHYAVTTNYSSGPFTVLAELWYQPIGFRWAHNLEKYQAFEPQRFVGYYNSMAGANAKLLARAQSTTH